jgi:hypothetical protein
LIRYRIRYRGDIGSKVAIEDTMTRLRGGDATVHWPLEIALPGLLRYPESAT